MTEFLKKSSFYQKRLDFWIKQGKPTFLLTYEWTFTKCTCQINRKGSFQLGWMNIISMSDIWSGVTLFGYVGLWIGSEFTRLFTSGTSRIYCGTHEAQGVSCTASLEKLTINGSSQCWGRRGAGLCSGIAFFFFFLITTSLSDPFFSTSFQTGITGVPAIACLMFYMGHRGLNSDPPACSAWAISPAPMTWFSWRWCWGHLLELHL